jgi:predicted ATPase/transcriptional regulator with XRE-family HTH domain
MRAQFEQMEDERTFGQWVKQRRKALDLTQADLAQRVSCSKSMINKIESNFRSPAKPLIELLAQHLKIPPAEYAAFVHRAQPHLLIEHGELLKNGSVGVLKPSSLPIKNHINPLTPLIGREREVAAVCAQLQQSGMRLLTLTGPGGTGKTRLALQVAAELNDEFADGVYFVSLAPVRDPALVLSTIVQALGLKSTRDQQNDELLITHLHEKAALLILDNFEQALLATKAIAELLLHTAYLKVLVTSRALLRLTGEHEFVVLPLEVPDPSLTADLATLEYSPAILLFVQRARAVRADFALTAENAHSVVEICARLDGLPLAIELAAARCKVLSPQAILARLTGAMGGALGLLVGGAQDLPARQQTIRQTIEWSYNLLSEREQVVFRRLGVFVGGCTLDAIEEAVCSLFKAEAQPKMRQVPPIPALDSAIALIDQSLLRQVEDPDGDSRFVMSETLREYAFESLSAFNELELMRRQHALYFLHMVETLEPKLRGAEQEGCLKRLDADYRNLRAALTWSCASEIEIALRLASVLWEYWMARGYVSEGRVWLTDILQRSDQVSGLPVRVRAQTLNGAGLLASVQGDQQAANGYLQESLRLFRELEDQPGEAWVLNHLGQTLNLSGQQEQAVPVFEASLQLFRALGDDLHSAWVLINLGTANVQRGETERALQLFSEARSLFSRLQYKRGLATAFSHLAHLAFFSRDFSQAKVLFSESLRLFDEIGDREGCGWALYHLGMVVSEAGQNHLALENLLESLPLFHKLNDQWGFVSSLLRLARVVRLQHPERAAVLFGAVEARLEAVNHQKSTAEYEFIQETLTEARVQADPVAWTRGQTLSSEKVLIWILEQSFLTD